MNKNIAIINSVYGIGSTGRLSANLSHFLNEHGFNAKVFYGRNRQPKDDNSFYFSLPLSISAHGLKARIFDASGFGSKVSTRYLIRKLDKFKPGLVIVHNMHGYYLNIKIFLNWLAKNDIKAIFVLHDCWNFTGHCPHFASINCYRWKDHCHHCPLKKEYPKALLFDKSERNHLIKKNLFSNINHATFISPSEWLADLAKESFLKVHDIIIINNGIDTNVFYHRENNYFLDQFGNDAHIILCVANIFNTQKGLKDIIALNSMLTDNERIVLVGKIKDNIELPKNITHIKQTNDVNELAKIYSSATVFFNPTYEDNYPTVNMEALACGCPVISYKTGGSCEMIDKNFAVEQGDISEAIAKIRSLYNKPNNYVFPDSSSFSLEKMYSSYLNIISKVYKTRS